MQEPDGFSKERTCLSVMCLPHSVSSHLPCCVCVLVYIYVCLCVCMHMHIHAYAHMCVCVCMYMHVCICACVYACECVCTYVLCVYACICMVIRVFTHVSMHVYAVCVAFFQHAICTLHFCMIYSSAHSVDHTHLLL